MKKVYFGAFLLLFSAVAFAQTREVYQMRANQDSDHKWVDSINSERFTIWFSKDAGDCASITDANAKIALDELETIFDVYMEKGFQAPYSATATKYKMGVYVIRNGSNCTNTVGTNFCGGTSTCSEGHAFGGTIGNPRAPGMWLSSGAVSDKWALAHEFMHGLQQMTGGMSGGSTNNGTNFTGWLHESHANLYPHLVYPTEIHYCAEMYTRTANLYLGSTRNRYCNWHFFEYLMDKKGVQLVNDIWGKSSGQSGADPFTEIMRQNSISQEDFNDIFGDFATKAVIWELDRGSPLFRSAFNKSLGNPDERFKRPRYTYLEALDDENAENNRYVVPFETAPQRYGFNIVRLYPDSATGTVKVRFRGDVQTENNIKNYSKNLYLEPAAANLPDDPGSDWRYGLVAVKGDAQATGGTVTARYSELKRASNDNPDVSIKMQTDETQLYLVVAATPTVHHKISWDQFYYTVYRFPYMVEINGAKPEGFQAPSNPAGQQHANGGGFKQTGTTVDSTAYIGPNARVLGTAQIKGNARIEGRAVVKGSAQVRDNAVVKDYALIAGGQVYGNAVVSDGAAVFSGQVYGDAKVHGAAIIVNNNAKIYGSAQVGGVVLIDNATNLSGTAQLLGDGEVYDVTATSGVYYGLVDDGVIGQTQYGGNRTSPPTEVTKPRSMTWYGEDISGGDDDDDGDDDDGGIDNITVAVPGVKFFNLNNSGIFSYNLGEATSAKLKIYNSKGSLIKTIPLNGAHGVVDIQINKTQVLLWKVEAQNGKAIGETKINTVIRK